MIRIGNYNPYFFLNTSHISVPEKNYAQMKDSRILTGSNMRKVSEVYVGDKHIYPQKFRYTLQYKMRLDFTFHGNSHGSGRPSYEYAEIQTTGYIEDIVRLDTVLPTFIHPYPLVAPEDYYTPHVPSGQYSQQPWGRIEQYRNFSGVEYLVTPACALSGVFPSGNGRIFERYGISGVGAYDASWRYIMKRTVHNEISIPTYWNWAIPPSSTDYIIRARKTNYPFSDPVGSLGKGYYINTSMRAYAICARRASNSNTEIKLGMTYRNENDMGGPGLYMVTDMDHYGPGSVLYARKSLYGCPPGDVNLHRTTFSTQAPMFTGHKHFDCYDTTWNVGRQQITGWEDPNVDEWSHTDLTGSFYILRNNNPSFASLYDYAEAIRAMS